MWPEADSPASAFTSIGKNVTSATTGAFDGQSKPNHITMIGATPTNCNAEKKLPSGSRERPSKEKRCTIFVSSRRRHKRWINHRSTHVSFFDLVCRLLL